MSGAKFIAADFGAESGRIILGTLENQYIHLEELHRFPNRQVKVFGHIYWDLFYLFDELKKGLAQAAAMGHTQLLGIGVDTWGVDFGLVGKDQHILGNPYCYRDHRTDGMMDEVFKLIPREEVYQITGIQFMQLNTIFQLFSMVQTGHPFLEICESLLFMPDLFNFLMTGEKVSEYTIASTSQLLDGKKRNWSDKIFSKLAFPKQIMPKIISPGTVLAPLLPEICHETGLSAVPVIAPASHDTASAVVSVPGQTSHWAYLSSGTWSLVGVEIEDPIIDNLSLMNNFTNEGGVNNTIRFLRNIMGMWLLERCRFCWTQQGIVLSYQEIVKLASQAEPFKCFINPDDPSFLNPPDMPVAIGDFCQKTGQYIPQGKGEIVRCIFESLAMKYRYIIERINTMIPHKIDSLNVVGGGSQNEMLNQFTANVLGIPVFAGPVEATALGNIIIQAIAKGILGNVTDGRRIIADSFPLKYYEPKDFEMWQEAYERAKGFFR
jgi:rhamnulokinase